jgi:hypothetical protein
MPKTADWTKTKTQFVYRHKQSGRYHVRAFRQGREVWKALGTTDYSVARSKAKEVLQEIHKTRILSDALPSKPTFGQVAELYREHVRTETGIKESTKTYWLQTIDSLLKSWPALESTRLSAITEALCTSLFVSSAEAIVYTVRTDSGPVTYSLEVPPGTPVGDK